MNYSVSTIYFFVVFDIAQKSEISIVILLVSRIGMVGKSEKFATFLGANSLIR